MTDPGPIVVDAPNFYIPSAPAGCSLDGSSLSCRPDGSGQVDVQVSATALYAGGDLFAHVDGDRPATDLSGSSVGPRAVASEYRLTGPVGGTQAGASLRVCATPNLGRTPCDAWRTDTGSTTLTVPAGVRVALAEVTWSATGGFANSNPALVVDGQSYPLSDIHQATAGLVTAWSADSSSGQPLAGQLSTGPHTLSMSGVTPSGTFAAWSLSVVWIDPAASLSVADYNANEAESISTPGGSNVSLSGAGYSRLNVTVWAADHVAAKKVVGGGNGLACQDRRPNGTWVAATSGCNPIGYHSYNGSNDADGLNLLQVSNPSQQPIDFLNRLLGLKGADLLYLGPSIAFG